MDLSDEVFSKEEIAELAYNIGLFDYRLLEFLPSFVKKTEKKSQLKSNDPELKNYEYMQQEHAILLIWLLCPMSKVLIIT